MVRVEKGRMIESNLGSGKRDGEAQKTATGKRGMAVRKRQRFPRTERGRSRLGEALRGETNRASRTTSRMGTSILKTDAGDECGGLFLPLPSPEQEVETELRLSGGVFN